MMLDATAGNRMMWAHNGKQSEHIVFFDKELTLGIPPDVFGTWSHLPFRDKVFSCVIFDPPHTRFGKNSRHRDTSGKNWWGILPRRKIDWLVLFKKASKEFNRVSNVLCFKWNETSHLVDPILSLFSPEWSLVFKKKHKSRMQRGKSRTWWVTFRSSR